MRVTFLLVLFFFDAILPQPGLFAYSRSAGTHCVFGGRDKKNLYASKDGHGSKDREYDYPYHYDDGKAEQSYDPFDLSRDADKSQQDDGISRG